MTDTRSPAIADDDTLLRRAFAAYFRSATEPSPDQPANDSYVTEHGGRLYVVLVNVNGVLAVYRVRNDGILKGLRRWPEAIEPPRFAEH
jgi:hypothetical protein